MPDRVYQGPWCVQTLADHDRTFLWIQVQQTITSYYDVGLLIENVSEKLFQLKPELL